MPQVPTYDEIASWPPPNYANPESLKSILVGIEGSLTGLAIVFVGARFYARTCVRQVLGKDDWVMLAAMILVAAITVLQCTSTLYAMGLHAWDVQNWMLLPTGKIVYATLVMFAPASALAKISICMTYLRVFPSLSDRRFAQFGIAFSVTYCLVIAIANIFQCWPIASYWAPWEHQQDGFGRCLDRETLTIATQALNSFSDFLIFLWPARTLWKVRIPVSQRLGLIFVFSVGVVVCITGVIRIWYLIVYFDSYDIYWKGSILCILGAVELNLGIICGSLPGCKPLLGLIFPRVFGTSASYSELSRPRQVLPGARISLRLSDLEKVYVPHMSRTASEISVPVKLDTGHANYSNTAEITIMTPVIEVASPAIPSPPPSARHSERRVNSGAFSFYNDNENDSS